MRPNLTRSDANDALRMRSYPPLLTYRPLWTALTACELVRFALLRKSELHCGPEPSSRTPSERSSSTSMPEYCQPLELGALFSAPQTALPQPQLRALSYLIHPLRSYFGASPLQSFFHLFSYQAFTVSSFTIPSRADQDASFLTDPVNPKMVLGRSSSSQNRNLRSYAWPFSCRHHAPASRETVVHFTGRKYRHECSAVCF